MILPCLYSALYSHWTLPLDWCTWLTHLLVLSVPQVQINRFWVIISRFRWPAIDLVVCVYELGSNETGDIEKKKGGTLQCLDLPSYRRSPPDDADIWWTINRSNFDLYALFSIFPFIERTIAVFVVKTYRIYLDCAILFSIPIRSVRFCGQITQHQNRRRYFNSLSKSLLRI